MLEYLDSTEDAEYQLKSDAERLMKNIEAGLGAEALVRMMQAHILASSTNIRSVKWGHGTTSDEQRTDLEDLDDPPPAERVECAR